MKTKVHFNHQFLMVLLVMGSVFSMIVSSAFTTSSAWEASLAQSGSNQVTSLSSINPAALGTENSVILTVGSIQASDKTTDREKHDKNKGENNEDTSSNNSTNPVVELSGTVSGLVMGPTLTSFVVAGVGIRMDTSLIQEWTIANGDSLIVEGHYLGASNNGTFLVTEMDKVQ